MVPWHTSCGQASPRDRRSASNTESASGCRAAGPEVCAARPRPVCRCAGQDVFTVLRTKGLAGGRVEVTLEMLDFVVGPVLALPRIAKRAITLAVDMALCTAAVWLAYYLRLGEFVSLNGRPAIAVAASILLAIPIFGVSGLYRAVLRHAGQDAMWVAVRACAVYGVLYASVFTIFQIDGVPRTVGIIQPLILFALVSLSRASASYWLGGAYRRVSRPAPEDRALIYGAGLSGQQLAAAITDAGTMKVVGYLDDDVTMQGRTVGMLRVYEPAKLLDLVADRGVNRVLLAIPSAPRTRRNEIIAELRAAPVEVRTLPGVVELAHGAIQVDDVRPLSVDDLLSRPPVQPDLELVKGVIANRVVMVTGAGGSIGSELTRQISALSPRILLLVENSEFALYAIHRELMELGIPDVKLVPLLGSVTDAIRMKRIIELWRPHQIYHVAAYKHVPLVEHNILEGIRNNVCGTRIMAELAAAAGVANFVLVSTDKAVRPTNTMGASKRLAEMILQGLASHGANTCFAMVRFGNVLGSSGSVVPLFREQIRQGGPVTITHPEVTRYFMTIPEAAQLVIQAGAMAQGGDVFVLDMGDPVRISDLARNMIELSGLTVRSDENINGDIAIKAIGLRPGEKLYEELLIGNNPMPTAHPRIMKANEDYLPWPALVQCLSELDAHIASHDVTAMRELMLRVVEDFSPSDALVDWTHVVPQQQGIRL